MTVTGGENSPEQADVTQAAAPGEEVTLPSVPPPAVPAPPRPAVAGGGAAQTPRRRRLRAWIAVGLVVFAVVTALMTAIGFWAHGLLFDTEKFVSKVAPVIAEPQVQSRLAERIVDNTLSAVDLERRMTELLPDRIKFLAGPLTDQIDTRLTERMRQLLATQQAYDLWERILTRAHETMIAVLEGDSTVLQLQGDTVVLNTLPLMARALERLSEIIPDVIASRIPTIDPDAPVEEQRAQLEAAIGRPIPDQYAQIELYQSDQVETAQKAVQLFNVLTWALLAITLALVAAALVVSPHRLRTLIQLGIGAVVAVALATVAINRLESRLIEGSEVEGTGLASIFTTIVADLTGYVLWLLIGGAILCVVAYLATRPKWVRSGYHTGRRLVSSGAHAGGRLASQAGDLRSPASAWIADHVDLLRVGGVVVGVLILLLARPGLGAGLAVIIIVAAYEFLISYLGRPTQGAEGEQGD